MATAPSDKERLSYRDLAQRLSISPDAARMKAKRKEKAGLWRVIPGNHPSDPVIVELPSSDLGVQPSRRGTVRPEQGTEQRPEQAPNIADRLLDELTATRARNDDLTDKLIAAKDVLALAYDKLISLNQELVSARIELIGAKDEVISVKEAHQRDERELVAVEMREMGTKAELEQALKDLGIARQKGRPQARVRWKLW